MPQENLRSAVYKSLKKSLHALYEDSNKSSTNETNRKSKTPSPMVGPMTMERRMTHKDPLPLFVDKEGKKAMASKGLSEIQCVPSSQLRQVFCGAQKLNQMVVGSWPNGVDLIGHSREVANDLLRGALDLKESLIMLKKLQEDTLFKAPSMKKQNPDTEKEKKWEFDHKELGAHGFQKNGYYKRSQTPEVIVDGSSRNCIEELKKVIRESLQRQNLLSAHADKEKASSERWTVDSFSDGPSASSSRSLTLPLRDEYKNLLHHENPDNCINETLNHKAKSPNLIAKLMGLEDFPSEAVQTTNKQLEHKKNLHVNQPNFIIDMPKSRKQQFVGRNANVEQRTPKEIIDAMQFKGLSKGNSCNDELQPHFLGSSLRKKRSKNFHNESSNDKMPPIVIIKLLQFPCSEREDVQPGTRIQQEDISDPHLIGERSGSDEPKATETIVRENEVSDSLQIMEKSGAKDHKLKEAKAHEGGISGSKPISNKMGVKERKIVSTGDGSSSKIKVSSVSVPNKQKKKDPIRTCKKHDETQSTLPERRKYVSENPRSAIASKSQMKTNSSKLSRPEHISMLVKNYPCCQTGASPNHNSRRSTQPVSQNFKNKSTKNQGKKEKQVAVLQTTNSVTENVPHNDDGGTVSLLEVNSISTTAGTVFNYPRPTDRQEEIEIQECHQEEPKSTQNAVSDPVQCRVSIEYEKEGNELSNNKDATEKMIETKMCLKEFFLRSPSFLNCAQALFDLKINQPILFQYRGIEVGMANSKLFLDCADELMTRKSHQRDCLHHPLWKTQYYGLKARMSMDQLVEELIDGIENLTYYAMSGNGAVPTDNLYVKLRRDLQCKGMLVNGVWDLGWVNAFSVEDADQVFGEVEKHVLSDLIEEVVESMIFL